ncbi:MAG: hypothetical protein H0T79_06000, partial [Deltaproteobacteria bacterium]|nr:hypothetical protein [Deltaproteobacteria bacterium]
MHLAMDLDATLAGGTRREQANDPARRSPAITAELDAREHIAVAGDGEAGRARAVAVATRGGVQRELATGLDDAMPVLARERDVERRQEQHDSARIERGLVEPLRRDGPHVAEQRALLGERAEADPRAVEQLEHGDPEEHRGIEAVGERRAAQPATQRDREAGRDELAHRAN